MVRGAIHVGKPPRLTQPVERRYAHGDREATDGCGEDLSQLKAQATVQPGTPQHLAFEEQSPLHK